MYPSYNSQKALQEERVRDLLTHTQSQELNQPSRISRLLTFLHGRLTAQNELINPHHALTQDQCLTE